MKPTTGDGIKYEFSDEDLRLATERERRDEMYRHQNWETIRLRKENKELHEEIRKLKKTNEMTLQYARMLMDDRDNRAKKFKEFEENIKQISKIYYY